MNIAIHAATFEKLGRLAAMKNSDTGTVLENLISEPLEEELQYMLAVQEGLDDIAAGRLIDHEDAMRELTAVIERESQRQA